LGTSTPRARRSARSPLVLGTCLAAAMTCLGACGSDEPSGTAAIYYHPHSFGHCFQRAAEHLRPDGGSDVPAWITAPAQRKSAKRAQTLLAFSPFYPETGTSQPLDPTFGESSGSGGEVTISRPVSAALLFYRSPSAAASSADSAYLQRGNIVIRFASSPSPSEKAAVQRCLSESANVDTD
jgi:hypothetical protein